MTYMYILHRKPHSQGTNCSYFSFGETFRKPTVVEVSKSRIRKPPVTSIQVELEEFLLVTTSYVDMFCHLLIFIPLTVFGGGATSYFPPMIDCYHLQHIDTAGSILDVRCNHTSIYHKNIIVFLKPFLDNTYMQYKDHPYYEHSDEDWPVPLMEVSSYPEIRIFNASTLELTHVFSDPLLVNGGRQ